MNTFAQSGEIIIQALSRMLLHSVWQGALLSVIAGVIIMTTKRTSAAIRYNLMLCLFGVFLLFTAGTFVYVLGDAPQSAVNQNVISSYSSASTSTTINQSNTDASFYNSFKAVTDIVSNYFNRHYILIISIWFVLFSLKSIYMAGNIVYMQRVRRYNVFTPSAVWQDKLTSLCEKLHIKKAVLLLESGYLKVPVVIGYFKPVILIPIGMLAGIAPAQIEAVLLHELAHIKRSDNIVNFLQHLAEAVFFFNPGLLWISYLLREERENCCDDMAIAQTNSKEDFVKALISFKEHSINYPGGSLAFSGRKSSLLNRVMRIVYQENKTFSNKESGLFLAAVAMITLMAFTFYPAKDVKQESELSFNRIPHKLQAKSVVYVPVQPKPDLNTGNVTKKHAVKSLTGKDDVAIILPADTLSPISNGVIAGGGAATITNTQDLISKAKFDNDKFYSRVSLGNGDDIIQVLTSHGKLLTTLKHDAKAAIVINDVLYDESEVAGLSQSQTNYNKGNFNGVGTVDIASAQKRYPDFDLSKYGAFVIVGGTKDFAPLKQPVYSP
jgi:beta-lactamase regulating signal transducer with metallopeptidase domain